MYKDIRLHGYVNDRIEFYATAAGGDAYSRYFFSSGPTEADGMRFFSPGNELCIDRRGVSYSGNGGFFCEYMFGVDQPIADLAKEDVSNRLALYGTRYDQFSKTLSFSPITAGSQSFEKIFFDGNAICNYFFAVTSTDFGGPIEQQQERIVKILGKTLKRSPAVGAEDDNLIIREILPLLGDPAAHLLLFKLINVKHREYRDAFKTLYFGNKKITDGDFEMLSALAERLGIDRYQQERIRIDVMYRHHDNRRIVDEYRNILIACHRKQAIDKLDMARLTRLKTLSVRNKIPAALFYTLDELLKEDKKLVDQEESPYIAETREIIEGIFLSERQIDSAIDAEDMTRLLMAKKQAAEQRDLLFEEMLLEASKACDEKIRDGADLSLLEGFLYIVTYFDRYDATSSTINNLAFMENIKITEDQVRSLLGNKIAFDLLAPGLFNRLFLSDIFENKYLGSYGRKKIAQLSRGLELIKENRLTPEALLEELMKIDAEERLHISLLALIKERIRNFYSKYATPGDRAALKEEVTQELRHRHLLEGEIPARLFNEALLTIKKEVFYIQNLLPQIVAQRDVTLREDFLENSGLDRFYIEELERYFFELNGLDLEALYQIRKGLNR